MTVTIDAKAIAQLHEATSTLVFNEDGSLRADAFGDSFPQFRLPTAVKAQIEDKLGQALEESTRPQILDAVTDLCIADEKFFQTLQSRMPKYGITVAFYDNFDNYHSQAASLRKAAPVNVSSLAASAAGGDISRLLQFGPSNEPVPAEMARTISDQLRARAMVQAAAAREATFTDATADMGLHIDRDHAQTELTDDARAALEAHIDATKPLPSDSFVADVMADGRTPETPGQIIAREQAKRRAHAEDPALGANAHPNYRVPTGTTTPEGIEAAREAGGKRER